MNATPADCARGPDAVALALGQLDPRRRAAQSRHQANCACCGAEASAAAALAARLRALPAAAPSAGFCDRVLAGLPPDTPSDSRPRLTFRLPAWRWSGAAAALLLLIGLALWSRRPRVGGPAPATPAATFQDEVRAACDWIASRQQADGAWQPSRDAGEDAFRPALTALATLALAEGGGQPYGQAVRRGLRALLRMQQPDGGFGAGGFGRPYNLAITTHALFRLRAPDGQAEPGVDAALAGAVRQVRATQSTEGGWGYWSDAAPNTALTVWHLDVLAQARAAGWGDPRGHLRRGLAWLSRRADPDGVFGYLRPGAAPRGGLTLTAMGAWSLLNAGRGFPLLDPVAHNALRALSGSLAPAAAALPSDLYRDLFLARALDCAGDVRGAGGVRSRVAAQRLATGDDRGAWPIDDPWGEVGGRLYATSVAVLALTPTRGG